MYQLSGNNERLTFPADEDFENTLVSFVKSEDGDMMEAWEAVEEEFEEVEEELEDGTWSGDHLDDMSTLTAFEPEHDDHDHEGHDHDEDHEGHNHRLLSGEAEGAVIPMGSGGGTITLDVDEAGTYVIFVGG